MLRSRTPLQFARNVSSLPSFLKSAHEHETHANIYSSNRRIGGFIKSGNLYSALRVFDEMPVRDVVSWNLLISGHGRCGHASRALRIYSDMVAQGIEDSSYTFSTVLSICCDAGFHRQGVQVHCRASVLGLSSNVFVASSLVDLYMHMGLYNPAMKLFNGLPERNLAIWNLVLRGFCEAGCSDELLGLFYDMKLEWVEPNALSFCYLLRGCSNGKLLDEGRQLHCHIGKMGWTQSNLFIKNALVDFYAACGSVLDTRYSFEAIPASDVISWNSVVALYAENGLLLDAALVFRKMLLWDKRPSARSFLGFLNWSSCTSNLLLGEQIHCCVTKLGFDQGVVHVQSALINMYGKCSEIERSVCIFHKIRERSLVSCNSLITSFFHCGSIEDAVEMFGFMVDEGIGFDEVTLSLVLKSLLQFPSGKLISCRLVHCCAVKSGFESHIAISCSLIDAYSKSGHIDLSCRVFENIPSPTVFCFTSIINGYARNGMGREGLETFKTMISMGLKPDEVTFLCVLLGCSHSGMVQEGRSVFHSMTSYAIDPGQHHFSCMVDMLGRAGLLDEAEDLLQRAPLKGDCAMWCSLLRSCRVYKNEMVGRRAAEILMELGSEDPSAYFQASSFYAEIGDFEASVHAREMATSMMIRREIGLSFIEAGGL